ncbi:hypothetical protein PHBOTO_004840 [Pseudozyma hubeiensis]|nr:hypothetical protein PHBOTO_004840 [Pseudozyma hubeiensis]
MPAPNQAFRGASLYSGIFDTPEQPKEVQQDTPGPQASTSSDDALASSSAKRAEPGTATTAATADAAASSKSSGTLLRATYTTRIAPAPALHTATCYG